MAIGASEHDVLRFVHRFDPLMALQAADAFAVRFGLSLIDQVARRKGRPIGGGLNRHRSGRAVAGSSGEVLLRESFRIDYEYDYEKEYEDDWNGGCSFDCPFQRFNSSTIQRPNKSASASQFRCTKTNRLSRPNPGDSRRPARDWCGKSSCNPSGARGTRHRL